MASFLTLGLMSGTSMDGLDIALTSFHELDGNWSCELHHCKTYSYNEEWLIKLSNSKDLSGEKLMLLNKDLGALFASMTNDFLVEFNVDTDKIDFIASHGHTVFHQPQNGFTTQIGCGETIAYKTGLPVINDFRTRNVLAGGQGAPLVPIGDKHLFHEYDGCINIGGFANITINRHSEEIIAFDISPANLPLNRLAKELDLPYDKGGASSREGNVIVPLLEELNDIGYYRQSAPKSLGTEWLETYFMPLLAKDNSTKDKLRTVSEHIAEQISDTINKHKLTNVLLTGGGAKNSFLVELIQEKSTASITVPDTDLIDFKEALIFGFLGCLYNLGLPNSLATVTGSVTDIKGGVLHSP